MNNCFICLKNDTNVTLVNITGSDTENLILIKLKNFLPELEWSLNFNICDNCIKELYRAYAFKELCINSYLSFKSKDECVIENDNIDNDSDFDVKNESDSNNKLLETHKTQEQKNHTSLKTEPKVKRYNGRDCSVICTVSKNNGSSPKKNEVDCEDNTRNINQLTNILPACELCGTTFKNNYLLKRHRQNVHATEKKFTCNICEKPFVSLVYLNAHKKYHSRTRPHICSFCGKSFITASDLYHHEKIHANKRAYQCEKCPKAFNTSSDLHKHKICVHTDRKEWKYICSYCDKRFPLKVNLDSHIKTHTGEKNFSCHLCYRKCINKSILMRHIETHTNETTFHCDVCSKGYKYKKSLDEHKAKVHRIGEVIVQPKSKKFVCHLCPKSYYANNKLEQHVRTHSGEKPFKCPHCQKCFADKSYIKQHFRSVHDIDMETSKFCEV